ncbi:Uncharacterised protein [Klebsiella grimontii]|uniref:Uncharacterized protein n=1 Tax=Klebsiella grimontii TaxID=2058152 RepID=A0A7H4PCT1_9ENTR|nr:Uncharacterised protein [Klebsiella grimontii]
MHFNTVRLLLMLYHLEREVSNFIDRLCHAGNFFGLRQQGIIKTGNSDIFWNGDTFFFKPIDNIVGSNIVINQQA